MNKSHSAEGRSEGAAATTESHSSIPPKLPAHPQSTKPTPTRPYLQIESSNFGIQIPQSQPKPPATPHVNPQNRKSPRQSRRFAWRSSYLQSAILKSDIKNRKAP